MFQAEMLCKEKHEDWVRKCWHVEKLEAKYLAQEPVIDNIVDCFIISINSVSESDSDN